MKYLLACALVGLSISTARAESTPGPVPSQAEEPTYAVGASYLATRHQYRGHGALVEGAQRIGRSPFWARVAVGGGVLTSPMSGSAASRGQGSGAFARAALGIEGRATSGEATIFVGVDAGYEYLGYDHAANILQPAMSVSTHAPLVMVRGGIELGGPRLRLRAAAELFGYQQRGVAFALGMVAGI